MELKFRVDWIRCDGYGLCGDLVPDLIDLDEWRYPIVRPGTVAEERLHDAQRAVDCCPMKALSLQPASTDRHGRPSGGSEARARSRSGPDPKRPDVRASTKRRA